MLCKIRQVQLVARNADANISLKGPNIMAPFQVETMLSSRLTPLDRLISVAYVGVRASSRAFLAGANFEYSAALVAAENAITSRVVEYQSLAVRFLDKNGRQFHLYCQISQCSRLGAFAGFGHFEFLTGD